MFCSRIRLALPATWSSIWSTACRRISYSTHAITKNMAQTITVYPPATSLIAPSGQNATGLTVLASSSNQSWGSMNLQQPQQQDSDPKGPLPLAVAVDTGATGATGSTPAAGNHARIVL